MSRRCNIPKTKVKQGSHISHVNCFNAFSCDACTGIAWTTHISNYVVLCSSSSQHQQISHKRYAGFSNFCCSQNQNSKQEVHREASRALSPCQHAGVLCPERCPCGCPAKELLPSLLPLPLWVKESPPPSLQNKIP